MNIEHLKKILSDKTAKELNKQIQGKSDDELFDMLNSMLPLIPKPYAKDNLYRMIKLEIEERTQTYNDKDEILSKYRGSQKFMLLWNKLDMTDQDLVKITQSALLLKRMK